MTTENPKPPPPLGRGNEYLMKDGRYGTLISSHPHDGALLVFNQTRHPDDEILVFFADERDQIAELVKVEPAFEAKPSVWYGKMPESNGRNNWTAILYSADKSESFTLDRSEYPHRVRYAADMVRHVLGDLPERPYILDYDSNERTPCHLCSGSGEKDGKPCWGLNFQGTTHTTSGEPK